MENRYLFRGKRIDTGEWAYGAVLFHDRGAATIFNQHPADGSLRGFEVNIKTICQCTGYEGIYEKDIFQCDDERYVIEWCDSSLSWDASAVGSSESISLGEFSPDEIIVIGNAIDNPELLEV